MKGWRSTAFGFSSRTLRLKSFLRASTERIEHAFMIYLVSLVGKLISLPLVVKIRCAVQHLAVEAKSASNNRSQVPDQLK
jgi:hypothetical protein